MSYKVTRLGPPRIRRDTIVVGDVVFEAADIGGPPLSDDTPLIESGAGNPGVATEASRSDHEHPEFGGSGVTLSDATPLVESGAGDSGTGTEASRDDHVHPADGGGGGGVSWDQPINEDGSSFANWTAATGTWASSGGKIAQTDTGGAWRKAKYNTKPQIGFPWIFEAEVVVVSVAGDRRAGIGIGDTAGGTNGLALYIRVGVGVVLDVDSAAAVRTFSTTINDSTTYKLRIVGGSQWMSVYLDGTLLGSIPLIGQGGWDLDAEFFTLYSYGTSATWDNIKGWVLSGGAPA